MGDDQGHEGNLTLGDACVALRPLDGRGQERVLRFTTVDAARGVVPLEHGVDRTGLMVWPGARHFAAWMRRSPLPPNIAPSSFMALGEPKSPTARVVLELGSGLGIGALVCAATLPGTTGVLSDFYEPALRLAERHVAANAAALAAVGSAGRVVRYDWTAALRRAVAWSDVCGFQVPKGAALGLVALDVIYPDTPAAVVAGFVATVADLVAEQHRRTNVDRVANATPSVPFLLDTPGALVVFVQRDTGATLRRLLTAAALAGLVVTPLDVSSSAVDVEGDRVPFPNVSCFTAETPLAMGEAWWSRFAGGCADDSDARRFERMAASRGDWLLSLQLSPGARPLAVGDREAMSNALQDGCEHQARASFEGFAVATPAAAPWLRLTPWLWRRNPCRAASTMTWDDNTHSVGQACSGSQGRGGIGGGGVPCGECALEDALESAAAEAEQGAFFGGFDV